MKQLRQTNTITRKEMSALIAGTKIKSNVTRFSNLEPVHVKDQNQIDWSWFNCIRGIHQLGCSHYPQPNGPF